MQRSANKKRRDVQFAEGELVWVKTDHLNLPSGLSRKLAAKWIGPFPILKVVNPVAMHVQLPPEIRLHPVLHTSKLKHHEGLMMPKE